jgi:hypothetical protein
MRQGDLSIVASSLHFALKTLRERWEQTGESWRDSVRQHYEDNHVAPLEPQVVSTLKAVNRLSQVFARAREECSEK